MRQRFCPRRAAKGREAMRQTHFAARLRVPSCPFVVKPPPHGFVLLRASSWSNLNRKASRSLVAQRALRATKNHSAWSSRSLAALREQNPLNFSAARLRASSWSFVVKLCRRKASCLFVTLRGETLPPGFAFLSGPSRTKSPKILRRKASCLFMVLCGKAPQHIAPLFPPFHFTIAEKSKHRRLAFPYLRRNFAWAILPPRQQRGTTSPIIQSPNRNQRLLRNETTLSLRHPRIASSP